LTDSSSTFGVKRQWNNGHQELSSLWRQYRNQGRIEACGMDVKLFLSETWYSIRNCMCFIRPFKSHGLRELGSGNVC